MVFSFKLKSFNFVTGLTMTNSKFDLLFGGPQQRRQSEITQRFMDIARSIQVVIEEVIIRNITFKEKLKANYLS